MLGIVKRNPTLGLSPFSEVDRFFDDFFDRFSSLAMANQNFTLPSVNIFSENDRDMVVEMEVPGYDQEDIRINLDGNILEIRGERSEKEEHKDKKRSYMVRENSQSFARRIVLPEGADTDKITAELDKGVLKVTVPFEQRESKRIEIAAPKSGNKAKLTATTKDQSETK